MNGVGANAVRKKESSVAGSRGKLLTAMGIHEGDEWKSILARVFAFPNHWLPTEQSLCLIALTDGQYQIHIY